MPLNRSTVAGMVDHTLLRPESTRADVADLIHEARDLGVYSVCVSPSMLPLTRVHLGDLRVTTVCGFPTGKHSPDVKAMEAAEAVAEGADEIDMVIDIGVLKAGRRDLTRAEISMVRGEAPGVLKVIIESAALTDEEIVVACQVAESAGADFVKTSTGFHPAGGATTHAVALMASVVGGRLGVKASGGIRDWATAVAMVEAGATRLGLSSTREVLAGAPE